MASMDKDGETSYTDPLKFTFIFALQKHDPIPCGPTVKAGVVCFLPFHFDPSFQTDYSIKIFPSLEPSLPAPQIDRHPGSEG